MDSFILHYHISTTTEYSRIINIIPPCQPTVSLLVYPQATNNTHSAILKPSKRQPKKSSTTSTPPTTETNISPSPTSQTTPNHLAGDTDIARLKGIPYRFSCEGTTGLLKIIPSYEHASLVGAFSTKLTLMFARMGVPETEIVWGRATRHPPSPRITDTLKEPDECFFPSTRRLPGGHKWPTLVLEVEVVGSLPRLCEELRYCTRLLYFLVVWCLYSPFRYRVASDITDNMDIVQY
ncbi:hypothetical protein ASPWEDRAFT_285142 [Aspergillus wentii DTO 134E9]|uniref:Uncharacterized protein n=1 Tax=Aspergillus wentii DTO 134E9 TaxID=1073089 RepID=A0A1L9S3P7_ASPWE|nr:uncharacterized protein ASPWEDRAFT_285142 [Aspergillus wentii DTO 134E9]OJJ41753.1 hypothetical protein ASPWEDRAFT_285142 [Aspergillus wentii DTO 134E9]